MDTHRTLDTLNTLIDAVKRDESCFRTSADYVDSSEIRHFFRRRADECRRVAIELQMQVAKLDGHWRFCGILDAAPHPGGTLFDDLDQRRCDSSILEQIDAGEARITAHYLSALERPWASDVRQLLLQQLDSIKRNHVQVRVLLRTGQARRPYQPQADYANPLTAQRDWAQVANQSVG
jgi:uncharacterized protein (TIGR02284 family)